MSLATYRHLPVWQNDLTLWQHATICAPRSWFAWAALGEAQEAVIQKTGSANPHAWDVVAASYRRALECRPPADAGGIVFFRLALANIKQGKISESNEHMRRALLLRPELQKWRESISNDVVTSGSRQ
jgi:hypothetical protein